MNRTLFAGLLAATLTSLASAAGTLEVQAITPTRVYLDGEFVGETPLVLSNMAAGDYQVQAEDDATGELRTFMFHVPTRVDVSKSLDVSGNGVAPTQPPPAQEVVYAPAPPQQVVYAPSPPQRVVYRSPPPAVCVAPPRVSYTRAPRSWGRTTVRTPRSRRERAKVHSRNGILGATLASQVFTKNRRDRKRFRNVGLGLGLLNEILR